MRSDRLSTFSIVDCAVAVHANGPVVSLRISNYSLILAACSGTLRNEPRFLTRWQISPNYR